MPQPRLRVPALLFITSKKVVDSNQNALKKSIRNGTIILLEMLINYELNKALWREEASRRKDAHRAPISIVYFFSPETGK